jgi:ribonuclease P protein component
MRQTFNKEERLKSRKLIQQLFAEGKSLNAFPIRLLYLPSDHDSPYRIQAGVTVSKRNFKKAVQRNRIKRLLREAYRKNKEIVYASENTKKHIFMFIYQGNTELEYRDIEERMKDLLRAFLSKQNSIISQ